MTAAKYVRTILDTCNIYLYIRHVHVSARIAPTEFARVGDGDGREAVEGGTKPVCNKINRGVARERTRRGAEEGGKGGGAAGGEGKAGGKGAEG